MRHCSGQPVEATSKIVLAPNRHVSRTLGLHGRVAVWAGLVPPYKPRLVDPGIARQGQKPDQCRTASPRPRGVGRD